MIKRKLYENYYRHVKSHKRIINKKDLTYSYILDFIERYIPKKGWILDVGSGTGTLAFYFASKGLLVDGVELSKKAFKSSIKNKHSLKINNVYFKNSSIEKFLSLRKYDLICCFEVLEHLDNDLLALKKISKLLKLHSYLLISVPSIEAPLYKIGVLKDFDRKVGHQRRYSVSSIKSLVRKTDLKVIKIRETEGLLKNLLFTNKFFGACVRFVNLPLVRDLFIFFDGISQTLFGKSQILLVCKKK